MNELIYVTGNKYKFDDGLQILKKYDINLVHKSLSLEEIQEIDGEKIAKHKALQAFKVLNQPLIVNDTTWMIPAINNFPGAFMQYTNDCFESDDWLRLMKGVSDRRVIMREILVFIDGSNQEIFFHDVVGMFLNEASGSDGVSSDKVISMRKDKKSIALARETDKAFTTSEINDKTSYDLLGKWLQSKNPTT